MSSPQSHRMLRDDLSDLRRKLVDLGWKMHKEKTPWIPGSPEPIDRYTVADMTRFDDLLAFNLAGMKRMPGSDALLVPKRVYLRVPNFMDQNVSSLCSFLTLSEAEPMGMDHEECLKDRVGDGYLYFGLALADISEDEMTTFGIYSNKQSDIMYAPDASRPDGIRPTMFQPHVQVMPTKSPGFRISLGARGYSRSDRCAGLDDGPTLRDVGFHRTKHAIQAYPAKSIPAYSRITPKILEDGPGIYSLMGLSHVVDVANGILNRVPVRGGDVGAQSSIGDAGPALMPGSDAGRICRVPAVSSSCLDDSPAWGGLQGLDDTRLALAPEVHDLEDTRRGERIQEERKENVQAETPEVDDRAGPENKTEKADVVIDFVATLSQHKKNAEKLLTALQVARGLKQPADVDVKFDCKSAAHALALVPPPPSVYIDCAVIEILVGDVEKLLAQKIPAEAPEVGKSQSKSSGSSKKSKKEPELQNAVQGDMRKRLRDATDNASKHLTSLRASPCSMLVANIGAAMDNADLTALKRWTAEADKFVETAECKDVCQAAGTADGDPDGSQQQKMNRHQRKREEQRRLKNEERAKEIEQLLVMLDEAGKSSLQYLRGEQKRRQIIERFARNEANFNSVVRIIGGVLEAQFGPAYAASQLLHCGELTRKKKCLRQYPHTLMLTAIMLTVAQDDPNNSQLSAAEVIHMHACAVMALTFPEQVRNGHPFAVRSGHPTDTRRDDKQYLIHFCWDRDADGNLVCPVVTVFCEDCDHANRISAVPAVQGAGLRPERIFVVAEDVHGRGYLTRMWKKNNAQLSRIGGSGGGHVGTDCRLITSPTLVEQAACITFSVEDCKRTLDRTIKIQHELFKKEEDKYLKAAEVCLVHEQPSTLLSLLNEGAEDVCERPRVTAGMRFLADAARKNKKLLFATLNFGERHPLFAHAASSAAHIEDNQDVISAIQQCTNFVEEGVIPFTLPPPGDATDSFFEAAWWADSSNIHRDPGVMNRGLSQTDFGTAVALALEDVKESLREEMGSDSEALDDEVAEAVMREASMDVFSEVLGGVDDKEGFVQSPEDQHLKNPELRDVLQSWLQNPNILAEQRERAIRIQEEWNQNGAKKAAASGVKRGRKVQKDKVKKEREDDGKNVPDTRALKRRLKDALSGVVKKNMRFRQVKRGLHVVQRLGLVDMQGGRLRINQRGSHINFHAEGGNSTTIVRSHKKSAPLTGECFLEKMTDLVIESNKGTELGEKSSSSSGTSRKRDGLPVLL